MYLDHRVIVKIARILKMVDASTLLLDNTGSVVLPEGDARIFTLPDEVLQNPTVPFIYGGVTLIGTADEQPVFVCLQGTSEDIKKCALLCAELLNMLIHEELNETTREQALRMMLRNEIDASEFEVLANRHDIAIDEKRCVFYFHCPDIDSSTATQTLIAAIDDERDVLAEVGVHSIALIKTVTEEDTPETNDEFAKAIVSSFMEESAARVYIGISESVESLFELPTAYEQARNSINVGCIFHTTRQVFAYNKLLLERFLNEVDGTLCTSYNKHIFNRQTSRLFNEEMIHTIETFFDNSLNLSETARKLYIHRNTLVYRLEKVQNTIGLDLRNFDDAVTFKMMMLLGKNESNRPIRL